MIKCTLNNKECLQHTGLQCKGESDDCYWKEEAKKMAEGRCMKCKKQVEMSDGQESVTKNNMRIMKGKCPECGTTVCRILGKAN